MMMKMLSNSCFPSFIPTTSTRSDSMTLTIPQDSKKALTWFDLNASTFFSLYKMEGVNPSDPDDDIIYFEANASYLLTALGSMKKAACFAEIKLGKEEFPFFTINMRIQSAADQEKNVVISNKVPVIIIPRVSWDDYHLPYDMTDFDVFAMCPRFPILKRFVETFKCSRNIRLVLRDDGSLAIQAKDAETSHFNIFNNIRVMKYQTEEPYKGTAVGVLVEQKKIQNWLHSLSPQLGIRLNMMIQQNRTLKLSFRKRDDIIGHFYVAADLDDDRDAESGED